jgi:hypothetical protein
VPRQQEADHAEHQFDARLQQPRPAAAEAVVDRAERPGADERRAEPHQQVASQLRPADRMFVAGEGELAVEPVTQQRAGDAPADIGRFDRHAPVAEEHQHAPVDQPLHAADQQVMPGVTAQAHGRRRSWRCGQARVIGIRGRCGCAS